MSILDSSSALSRLVSRQGLRPSKGEVGEHILENKIRKELLILAKDYDFTKFFPEFNENYRSIIIEYIETTSLSKKTFEKIFGSLKLNQIIQALK